MRIFGVDQSEEFDYRIVNKLFPIAFKIYVKKIACYPQLITREIYTKACSINIPEHNRHGNTGFKTSIHTGAEDLIPISLIVFCSYILINFLKIPLH